MNHHMKYDSETPFVQLLNLENYNKEQLKIYKQDDKPPFEDRALVVSLMCLAIAPRLCFSARTLNLAASSFHRYHVET